MMGTVGSTGLEVMRARGDSVVDGGRMKIS